jgi:hypothetical protein
MPKARPLAVFMFALVAALALMLAPLAGADDDDDDDGGGGGDAAFCAPAGPPEPGQCSLGAGAFIFDFDASSGPLGENPTGTFRLETQVVANLFFELQVTCLQVTGNRASIGGTITAATDPGVVGQGLAFTVLDNTPVAPDLISSGTTLPVAPPANTPNCGDVTQPTNPVEGDIVVQDNIGGGDDDDEDEDDDDD